jgi:photosystem II stability/assembly factor-like uncharacterized protein
VLRHPYPVGAAQRAEAPPAVARDIEAFDADHSVALSIGEGDLSPAVYLTADGGRTWTRFDTGSFDAVACAAGGPWDGGCWASGENGRVARLRWGH